MKKICFLGVLLFTYPVESWSQGAFIPYDRDYYHLIERYEIKSGNLSNHLLSTVKPFQRDLIAQFLLNLPYSKTFENQVDQFNFNYLTQDNWEFLTTDSLPKNTAGVYKQPSDFYHIKGNDFDFHLNPILYLGVSNANNHSFSGQRNTRGLEFRGRVNNEISFYSQMTANEVIFPNWIQNQVNESRAIPGEGYWKRYKNNGYSYFSAIGHINFDLSQHIHAQVGHDRNFMGEGYRSMILSDFSSPYFFTKIQTKIGKIQLSNLWAQMTGDVLVDNQGRPKDARYPQKWFAHHRLSFPVGQKIQLGFFESIMMNTFNVNYLNPVIFYRWVEHQLGSPDKVMIGSDFKYFPMPGMQLYGQFALDEFVFKEFFGQTGRQSNRNKYGLQAGLKIIDVAKVNNLDFQLEYNQARPYTYQEKFDYQSFSNYRNPLTHPLGANFREFVAIWRYQPLPKLSSNLTLFYQRFGTDPSSEVNFGKNVWKSRVNNQTGKGLFGHYIGQGILNEVYAIHLNLSYMIKHNVFLDFAHTFRTQQVENVSNLSKTPFTQMAIRMNINRADWNF
jgi:hypothetical protein